MRAPKGAAAVAIALISTTACSSDLFHDTTWPSACELDPTTPGCPGTAEAPDAGDGAAGAAPDGGDEGAAD